MKSVLVTLGAIVALAAAQDVSGLPKCGQFCATSMLGEEKAAELNCKPNDIACLCKTPDFIYGFRDCSSATCGGDDARKIVDFGLQVCRGAGVEITSGPGQNPSATGTSAGGNENGKGSVSTIFSTFTTDSSAIVTAISTATISGGNTGSSNSGSASPTSGSGGLVSTITSDGSTIVTTFSTVTSTPSSATGSEVSSVTESDTATETGGESSTGGSSATGSESASSSASSTEAGGAAMPQRTIAPAAIIGAGLAAFLL